MDIPTNVKSVKSDGYLSKMQIRQDCTNIIWLSEYYDVVEPPVRLS